MEITVRPAQLNDAKRIWEIRNEPQARSVAANPEIIPLSQHVDWFKNKYFENKGNYCFVAEADHNVIGYCRFDLDDDQYINSIAVDSSMHGKGVGTLLLHQSIEQLQASPVLTGRTIHAEIRKHNIASIKMFERVGFKKISEDDKNVYYQLN